MLDFYGLQCETNNEDEINIRQTTSFPDRKQKRGKYYRKVIKNF
ncbi:hypothetical protein ACN4EE_21465 [Geminocystis sp. CENA526]